jgi:microcystin-dependent protein
MSEPYIGEIRAFGFNFAPLDWMFCAGQTLAISQYTALYSVIGTTYGGDGQTTFLLPNLQGSVPMGWGNGPGGFNTAIGQVMGTPYVTLTSQQMPYHQHAGTAAGIAAGGDAERTPTPSSTAYLASSNPSGLWQTAPTINAPFSASALQLAGGSQPHENMQPYLTINFCICVNGIFPPRS